MSSPTPSLDDLRIERSAKTPPPRRTGLILTLLALLLLAGGGAWWLMRPKPVEVRLATAREAARSTAGERTVLNASGYVTAQRAATVSSKVTGKVMEVDVEEGDKVAAGQVLARLDDTNVRASAELAEAQLTAAKSALEETRVRLREAEQELERQDKLIKGSVATQADHDHAEAAAFALRAHLNQLTSEVTVGERQITIWKQQIEDTVIRAPFAGVVTSKNAQPGEMISPMSSGGFTRTGICTLVDMSSLEIEIDVNESYINRVSPGQPVEATLDAYTDWKIPCKVIAIIPTADRQKSTVKVRVGFDQLDPRILPEMGVKVAFHDAPAAGAGPAAKAPARLNVIVPQSAVVSLDGHDYVFVARDGKAERRAVTVAMTTGDDTEIAAGLSGGEKIILDAPAGLADGTSVEEKKP